MTVATLTSKAQILEVNKAQLGKLTKAQIGAIDLAAYEKGYAMLLAGLVSGANGDTLTKQPAAPAQTAGLLVTLFHDVTIPETDGKATIAQASGVFPGYLDSDFKNWGTDQPSPATPAMTVTVSEMHQDVNFRQVFVPPNGKTLDDLCLTQAQIIEFCKKHSDKLRQDGYATLFLFKVGSDYFVAGVLVVERELKARVYRFDNPSTCSADNRRRVVVPQLQ